MMALTTHGERLLGIQDALGIERAHLVCQSMFGGIGLIAGVDHPDRVASLTFVSSPTGEAGHPPPTDQFAEQLPADPDPADSTSVVECVVGSASTYAGGSPYFDEAATRALVERDVGRARDYASTLPGPVWDAFVPALHRNSGRGRS